MFIYLPTEAAKYTGITSFNFGVAERSCFTKQVVFSVPTNVYMVHVEWAVIQKKIISH
jgi:hypothetical protein